MRETLLYFKALEAVNIYCLGILNLHDDFRLEDILAPPNCFQESEHRRHRTAYLTIAA